MASRQRRSARQVYQFETPDSISRVLSASGDNLLSRQRSGAHFCPPTASSAQNRAPDQSDRPKRQSSAQNRAPARDDTKALARPKVVDFYHPLTLSGTLLTRFCFRRCGLADFALTRTRHGGEFRTRGFLLGCSHRYRFLRFRMLARRLAAVLLAFRFDFD